MKKPEHILVFDGTSHYVAPIDYELQEDEVNLGEYYRLDYAQLAADRLNEKCQDHVH